MPVKRRERGDLVRERDVDIDEAASLAAFAEMHRRLNAGEKIEDMIAEWENEPADDDDDDDFGGDEFDGAAGF